MIYFSMNVLWPQQVASLYATDEIEIGWLSVRYFDLLTGFLADIFDSAQLESGSYADKS